jgi:hypothetical protein
MKTTFRRLLAALGVAMVFGGAATPAIAQAPPPIIRDRAAALALLPDGTPVIRDRA